MINDPKDKRQRILDAASDLIIERGLQSTPMSLITKRAGVAVGSLYNYFTSKQDLVYSVFQRAMEDMAEAILAEYSAEASVQERFTSYWSAFLRYMLHNPNQTQLLLYLTTTPYIDEGFREKASSALLHTHAAIIKAGRQEQLIRDVSTIMINWHLYGSLLFLTNKMQSMQKLSDSQEAIDQVVQMWWDSIRR